MVGCNFFKWHYKDGVDERDAIIVRQRMNISGLEKSFRVWKKQVQLSLVVTFFVVVLNIVFLMGCNSHGV